MKKSGFLFALAVIPALLVSCEKCQTCTTTTHQTVSGYTQTSDSEQEYCGDDYDDAPAEGTTTQSTNEIDQEVVIECEPS